MGALAATLGPDLCVREPRPGHPLHSWRLVCFCQEAAGLRASAPSPARWQGRHAGQCPADALTLQCASHGQGGRGWGGLGSETMVPRQSAPMWVSFHLFLFERPSDRASGRQHLLSPGSLTRCSHRAEAWSQELRVDLPGRGTDPSTLAKCCLPGVTPAGKQSASPAATECPGTNVSSGSSGPPNGALTGSARSLPLLLNHLEV